MTETRSTCPYCGVGCGVIISAEAGRITGVRGDPDHPANAGRLCTKGANLHRTATVEVIRQTRLLQPLRRTRPGGAAEPVTWDAALDEAADRFAAIIAASGPDAVGVYASGQLLTEDYHVFNKLTRTVLGTNNIDTNSRLCMSSAVAGYKCTLGADAPPACYEDIAHADCLFIAGSNAAWAHPVLYRRVEDARRARPGLRVVVCDPRRTETAAAADLHLPLQPGTDVMLFNGMLHLMLWEGWIAQDWVAAHTSGFDALKAAVRDCTPARVAQVCGITQEALQTATRWFATSPATLSLYCQGLNQSTSGTDKNAALINLHLATGQIGRPGAGPLSLTGQPNAMGGREVGALSNLLPGHREAADASHRAEVAALWGSDALPAKPGKSAVEMFQAAADGQIRALWIVCTNPAQSLPDQPMVRRALERAEFVVVQEAFATTATCDYAHLLLPASTWGEKSGSVTNSERRISRVRAAVAPPGQARHDWAIAADVARRLERRLRPGQPTLFPWDPTQGDAALEAIWNEHRSATRGRDLDISGLSYALLDVAPQQWPMPEGASQGRPRLYEDGRFPTPDARARFASVHYRPVAEPRDARYPFALNTGRLRDQWHGMSRTGQVPRLFGHQPEPALELHPQDMARRQLPEGGLVRVRSRRGEIVLPVRASADMGLGQAFLAMHWGPEFLGGSTVPGGASLGVNALTQPAFCAGSRQPELKHAAVAVSPAGFSWSLVAMAWLPEAQLLSAREALRPLLRGFRYASCVPFGFETGGLLLRAAGVEPAVPAVLQKIESVLGLAGTGTLRYADARRGQLRIIDLEHSDGEARVRGFLLAGDTRSADGLRGLLLERKPAQALGRALLLPGLVSSASSAPRARPVCACLNVTDQQIDAHLARASGDPSQRLASLQQALQCGSQCGSCVPELRRRVSAIAPAADRPVAV